MKLDKEIKEKRTELATRKGVIFHQDNARPYTYLFTRKKLVELGWEVMPHPPYSPNFAPSDYHLNGWRPKGVNPHFPFLSGSQKNFRIFYLLYFL